MRIRPQRPAARPAFIMFSLSCLLFVVFGLTALLSAPRQARAWSFVSYEEKDMPTVEERRAALEKLSAVAKPDKDQLKTLIALHTLLAKSEPDREKRAAHWKTALELYDKAVQRDRGRYIDNIPAIIELLLALQSAPDDPLPAYRAALEKRIAAIPVDPREEKEDERDDPEKSDAKAPSFSRIFGSGAESLIGGVDVAPDDLRLPYFSVVFRILGDSLEGLESDDRVDPAIMSMLRCLVALPAEGRQAAMDAMHAKLEQLAAKETEHSYRSPVGAAEGGLALLDLIRLLQTTPEGFDLGAALNALDERDGALLAPVAKMASAGGSPGTPDARQRELIASAAAHCAKAYSGDTIGYYWTRGLGVVLHTFALARFPDEPKLQAGYALFLSPAWDADTRQYSSGFSSKEYEGLPKLNELLEKAEKKTPDDPVVLQARLRTAYPRYGDLTGTAFNQKVMLVFKLRCQASDTDEAWLDWGSFTGSSMRGSGLDEAALFKDFDAFGKRCPSFTPYAKFSLNEARRPDRSDEKKYAEFQKNQKVLLETALAPPHPKIAEALLNGNLGRMAYEHYRDEKAKDRVPRMQEALDRYARAREAWVRKKEFPWSRAQAELYEDLLKTPEIPLTPELLDDARGVLQAERRGKSKDSAVEWAQKLFSLADSARWDKRPERVVLLAEKGLASYAEADPASLSERDWVIWADRLKEKATRERNLNDPAVMRQIADKLERALAFNPYGARSNEMVSRLQLSLMSGTPEADWKTLPAEAYGHYLIASGLPPTGARAFFIWAQSLYEAAGKNSDSPRQAMRKLAEKFDAAAQKTEKEREALLLELYPDKARELMAGGSAPGGAQRPAAKSARPADADGDEE